jgi:hypothetical protein
VSPRAAGGVRIVAYQRQAPALDRDAAPAEGRGEVVPIAGMLDRNHRSMPECRGYELNLAAAGCRHGFAGTGCELTSPGFNPKPDGQENDEHRKHPLQGGARDGLR